MTVTSNIFIYPEDQIEVSTATEFTIRLAAGASLFFMDDYKTEDGVEFKIKQLRDCCNVLLDKLNVRPAVLSKGEMQAAEDESIKAAE